MAPRGSRPLTSPIKTASIRFDDVGGGIVVAKDTRQQDMLVLLTIRRVDSISWASDFVFLSNPDAPRHQRMFRKEQMLPKNLRPGKRESVFVSKYDTS